MQVQASAENTAVVAKEAAQPGNTILYLGERDIALVVEQLDVIGAVRSALVAHGLSRTVLPNEAYLSWSNDQGESARSLNMPGLIRDCGLIVGTKIINANPENYRRELPRASGITVLFDPVSARVTCVLAAAQISALRTAAVSALSALELCDAAVEHIAIIGTGALAEAHVYLLTRAMASVRKIAVFDIDPQRAQRFVDRNTADLAGRGIKLLRGESAAAAIRDAHLTVAVTTTTTGYIELDWLRPGAVLINVSLDDALPEVLLGCERLFVDDWNLVKTDDRRLLGRLYRSGHVVGPDDPVSQGARRVDAELGAVLAGLALGRTHPRERIVVNPFGMAIEDLAVAHAVFEAATTRGLGQTLER